MVRLSYPCDGKWDGVLSDLPVKLIGWVHFDNIVIDDKQNNQSTVHFRDKEKEAFHFNVTSVDGRCVIEIGGVERLTVDKVTQISRKHFDQWFGNTPHEQNC